MKTKCSILLVAAVAAVAFVGCTSDDDVTPTGVKQSLTFVATADGGAHKSGANDRMFTRLNPDADNSVWFCQDDAISVFSGSTNNKFTTADGGASVEFNGKATQTDDYYALYPYQDGATISGSTISATLPATQTAQTGAPYFDPKAALSVATTTDESRKFYFCNVGGLVKVTTKEALTKLVFRGNDNEMVAGTVSITVGEEPSYTGANATSVTLRPAEEGTTIPAGTYYFVVLPQTFTKGFTIEAYQEGNETTTPDYTRAFGGKITLPRSRVLNVGEMVVPDPFNGHDYVDLGIEVDGYKVLWATTNVGATTPEGYGYYFAWGETAPYYDAAAWSADGKTGSFAVGGSVWKTTPKDYSSKGYNWVNYAWCNGSETTLTKYNNKESNGTVDNKAQLELADDAARKNWGGDWVMPTQAEWAALCDNTTNAWTTDYNGTGVKGRVFTSKKDTSKSIFFPAAGDFLGTSIYYVGANGFYWSSSLYADDSKSAYYFSFGSGTVGSDYHGNNRYYGHSVRPVIRMAK